MSILTFGLQIVVFSILPRSKCPCHDTLCSKSYHADEDRQGRILDHKMVSAVHGSLIETDIPCKVYILHINEQLPPAERFVIQDLDETHLLVQPHRLEYVKAEVKAWQQKNQFTPPTDLRQT